MFLPFSLQNHSELGLHGYHNIFLFESKIHYFHSIYSKKEYFVPSVSVKTAQKIGVVSPLGDSCNLWEMSISMHEPERDLIPHAKAFLITIILMINMNFTNSSFRAIVFSDKHGIRRTTFQNAKYCLPTVRSGLM